MRSKIPFAGSLIVWLGVVAAVGCTTQGNPMHASLASSLTGTYRGHFDATTCDTDYVDMRTCAYDKFYGFSGSVTLTQEHGNVTGTISPPFDGVLLRGKAKGNRADLSGQSAESDEKKDITATVELLSDGTLAVHLDGVRQFMVTFFPGRSFTTHYVVRSNSLTADPVTP